MHQKYILNVVLFLVMSFECFQLVVSRSYNNGLIFYDLKTFQSYLPPTVSVSRGRGLASVKYSEKGSIWSTFGKPCECRHRVCGCCAGIKVKQYNFDQKMCANVTFVPPKEEALLEVYLNDKPSSKYGISVRNPSPFCIPVMMGIPMAMCVQMSNIAIQGNNLNMCMDFIVRLATTDLFEMHFQCMKMGLEGFQYIDKDGNPVIPPGNSKTQIDDDYYDYEEDENEISYASNEEADKNVAVPQTANTIDSTYIIGLQQQMQQLQNAQQVQIKKNDLLTQINVDTTLAPMIVEAQTEIIAAITTAYGTTINAAAEELEAETEAAAAVAEKQTTKPTESETEANIDADFAAPETKTQTTTETETEIASPTMTITSINPFNNELQHHVVTGNNYNDMPTTAENSITSTTEAAINKPIAAPINVYTAATTSENIIVGGTVDAVSLENVATNYAFDTINTTDSNIDIETTTMVDADPTPAYISAPSAPTAAATMNSTTYDITTTEEAALQDAPSKSTGSTTGIEPIGNENASIVTSTMLEAPTVAPAVNTSYRYLYRW